MLKLLKLLFTLAILTLFFLGELKAQSYIQASSYYAGDGRLEPVKMIVVGSIAHILSYTDATNLPVINGSAYHGDTDMYYMQIDEATGNILFATYIGGSGSDHGTDMQIVGNDVYLLGGSTSNNYPVSNGTTHAGVPGSSDVVCTKLDATFHNILASTYLGGNSEDQATKL
jgi:hypothetical protein